MKKTTNPVVAASSMFLEVLCLVGLALSSVLWCAEPVGLPQEIITYGFLSWNYGDVNKLLGSSASPGLAREMKALQGAFSSLNCDIPTRLSFPHKAFIVPSFPVGQWIGFVRTAETPPEEGTLFVTEPRRTKMPRVLVVLSSVAPERTTVFSIEERDGGYVSSLVYDSFKKGKIRNANHTVIGAVTAVSVGNGDEILLREWAEPGSRPGIMGSMGRVFQIDPNRDEILLKKSGALPRSGLAQTPDLWGLRFRGRKSHGWEQVARSCYIRLRLLPGHFVPVEY
jgi:hypothetical protein